MKMGEFVSAYGEDPTTHPMRLTQTQTHLNQHNLLNVWHHGFVDAYSRIFFLDNSKPNRVKELRCTEK